MNTYPTHIDHLRALVESADREMTLAMNHYEVYESEQTLKAYLEASNKYRLLLKVCEAYKVTVG